MPEKLSGNMLIAQGGGPTAVINSSLVGAVKQAKKYSNIKNIYGSLNGVNGIINENIVDLSGETDGNLDRISRAPASALLSTRDKADEEYCEKIFKVLKAHNIRFFFYIGGNDSSDTLRIVKEFETKEDYKIITVHIPKTVDNDLVLNDHTPGYPSAARFVAEAFVGLDLDNRSLPGVYIAVVMGRHAGFLTAASALARRYTDDGPHLIYLPERKFSEDNFVKDVQENYNRYGRCVIAVSEGIQDESGRLIAAKLTKNIEKDAHGNIQLSGSGSLADALSEHIKDNTDIGRVRSDTFGYLQRSFRTCVSKVDRKEAFEVGRKAVYYAADKNQSGSVTINRVGDYSVEYKLVELEKVAGKTKVMPDEFINDAGNNITEKFVKYLRPMLGADFVSGAARIRAEKIVKKL
ncbi:MAG: 6-phosphofructokinase [Elusimicrobia bacterium]|jgi:6-phosphofructokinase|nr:6-phosphofructokinase [Elusimicrobiota bacterium]